MSWTVRVLKILHRETFNAAIIEGWPSDLCFYNENAKRSTNLFVEIFAKGLYQFSLDDFGGNDEWSRLVNLPGDEPPDVGGYEYATEESNRIILVPHLTVGMEFGGDRDSRNGMWCWKVVGLETLDLPDVAGLSHPLQRARFALSNWDNTGHEEADFVPGLGFTRYFYHHNGSTSDVEMQLVKIRDN